MQTSRLVAIGCFVGLMSVNPQLYADDPAYTSATLTAPSSVQVGVPFAVSGHFIKSFTGPTTDYVIIEVRDGMGGLAYSSSGSMTPSTFTKINFDSASLPAASRPAVHNIGTYTLQVRAMKTIPGGTDNTLKTVSSPLTVTP